MKKFIVAALLLLMVGSTSLAFAWWDSLETTENNVTIGIGEGVTLEVELDTQTDGVLVPSGVVLQPNQVTSYVISYEVDLDTTVSEALLLSVLESNVAVGGESALGQYIGFDIVLSSSTIQNDTVTVTVTVTLELTEAIVINDSLDISDFTNENITFDLTFTATQNN